MTTEEFSDGFDTLLDSYRRFKDFDAKEELDSIDFNEYEKSIFLTKAQEQLVKEYYSDLQGVYAFENTEEIRRSLDSLVKQIDYTADDQGDILWSTNQHTKYTLPSDCWYIVYEQIRWGKDAGSCWSRKVINVVPVTHDEYWRTLNNPFKGPNDKRALRLDINKQQVEIVSKYSIDTYTVRYMAKPEPIILVQLPEDLTIEGESMPKTCQLHSGLHQTILERAVRLALASKISTSNNNNKSKEQ